MFQNKRKDIIWRIRLVFGLTCVIALAIFSKSFQTQFIEGEHWRSLADSLTIYPKTIAAERGNIYSEDGKLLATSIPQFEIRMDFRSDAMTNDLFSENVDSLALYLAKYVGRKSKAAYRKELIDNRYRGNRYYLIKRKVSYTELKDMKKWPFFREGRYASGMVIIQKNTRKMPFGLLAQRTIGYVRDEGRFRVGIEGSFDKELTGKQGQVLVQKIAGGTFIPLNGKGEISAEPGNDIYTTLNIDVQDVAEAALYRALEVNKADHGCVVLLEVKTGKIKALANLGKHPDGFYTENFNYAVGEAIEPGSTFKLASIMALLEDKKIKITDSIDLEGGKKRFYRQYMRDSHKPKKNVVTIKKAFEESSNVAMSKLIAANYSDDKKQFYDHLVDFHLNQPVGIELKGEAKPVIRHYDKWSGVSLPWMAVGYEVQLTPLQMATFYNAIANNGKMVKPYLVDEVKSFNETLYKRETEVLRERICSESTLNDVQDMLEGVVLDGTAKNLLNRNYSVAGKTGTAQRASGSKGYKVKSYASSFVGYFPADNPKYTCAVVVNNPTAGRYYGSSVAGPVFKEIADKLYATDLEMQGAVNEKKWFASNSYPTTEFGYSDDITMLYNRLGISWHMNEEALWVSSDPTDNSVSLNKQNHSDEIVPDVRGMSLKDALFLLENKGIQVKVEGIGKVKRQSIRRGTKISENMQIVLDLGI